VEAFRKKEGQDETQFTTKIDDFQFHPLWNYFAGFFPSHPVYDETHGSGAVFVIVSDNSDVWVTFEILCVRMMDVYVP
jgi:hypothetical protein